MRKKDTQLGHIELTHAAQQIRELNRWPDLGPEKELWSLGNMRIFAEGSCHWWRGWLHWDVTVRIDTRDVLQQRLTRPREASDFFSWLKSVLVIDEHGNVILDLSDESKPDPDVSTVWLCVHRDSLNQQSLLVRRQEGPTWFAFNKPYQSTPDVGFYKAYPDEITTETAVMCYRDFVPMHIVLPESKEEESA